jgi:hypothetical protein
MPTVPIVPQTKKQQLLEKYNKAVAAMVKAEASMDLDGGEAANQAYSRVTALRDQAAAAGVKVPALPTPPPGVVRKPGATSKPNTSGTGTSSTTSTASTSGTDTKEYGTITYDTDKPQPTIGAGGMPVYIVSLPVSNRGGMLGDVKQTQFNSPPEARNAFIKAYFQGRIPELQNKLLQSKWTTKERIKSGNGWLQDLDAFIADYSSFVVREGQYPSGPVAADSMSTFDYLSKQKMSTGGGSTTTVSRQFSTRAESNQLINQYLINLIGTPATAQQKEDYFQILHAAETKATSTATGGAGGGSVTGGYLTPNDRELLAAKIARTAIKGLDAKTLMAPGAKGSKAAMDVRDLQSFANDYGIQLDEATALSYVASGLGTEDYLNKQKERIRLNAMALYPNLAPHIKAGGTVKDVAD